MPGGSDCRRDNKNISLGFSGNYGKTLGVGRCYVDGTNYSRLFDRLDSFTNQVFLNRYGVDLLK